MINFKAKKTLEYWFYLITNPQSVYITGSFKYFYFRINCVGFHMFFDYTQWFPIFDITNAWKNTNNKLIYPAEETYSEPNQNSE